MTNEKLIRYIVARNEMNGILCRCIINRIVVKDGDQTWYVKFFVA